MGIMGVRRLFSRGGGGQNFPGERGHKHNNNSLKMSEKILFSHKKVERHTIFGRPKESKSPSCPPLRTPIIGIKVPYR
jgi:hypothetical protein